MMAVVGVRIAGVNVKTRFCDCGMRVFDAVAYGAGEVMTFDAMADDDVKEDGRREGRRFLAGTDDTGLPAAFLPDRTHRRRLK